MLRSIVFLLFLFSTIPAKATNLNLNIQGQGFSGTVSIDLFENLAPLHVERIILLANKGAYNGVYFHRVIEGFMAQTGDVKYGKIGSDIKKAGLGGSSLADLTAEFSDFPFDRGVVGMARATDPNSANSQFFIMFAAGHFLNGKYTVVGRVTSGMDVIDKIKRGQGTNGLVLGNPDFISTAIIK